MSANGSAHDITNDPFLTHSQVPVNRPEDRAPVVRPAKSLRAHFPDLKGYAFKPAWKFCSLALLFAFCHHELPVIPWIFVVSMVITTVSERPRRVKGGADAFGFSEGPVIANLLAVLAGALVGLYVVEHFMTSFWMLASGRWYHDALASNPAAAYADAGSIQFSRSTMIDNSRAASWRDTQTYCAAPLEVYTPEVLGEDYNPEILNRQPSTPVSSTSSGGVSTALSTDQQAEAVVAAESADVTTDEAGSGGVGSEVDREASQGRDTAPWAPGIHGSVVSFWAVGTDCCGIKGSFWCGDLSEPTEIGLSRQYTVVEAPRGLFFNHIRDQYDKAISQAEAAFGMRSDPDRLLVRISKHPQKELQFNVGVTLLIIFSLTFFIVLFGVLLAHCLVDGGGLVLEQGQGPANRRQVWQSRNEGQLPQDVRGPPMESYGPRA